MSTERDTHFANAAELLYDGLRTLAYLHEQRYGDHTAFDAVAKEFIAQFAYDLVYHAVGETIGTSDISHVSDLTEWPTDPGTSQQTDTPS